MRDAQNLTSNGPMQMPGEAVNMELLQARRRRKLASLSGLQLACLIIDCGVIQSEDSDPIEAILEYEFGTVTPTR